MTRTKRHFTEG